MARHGTADAPPANFFQIPAHMPREAMLSPSPDGDQLGPEACDRGPTAVGPPLGAAVEENSGSLGPSGVQT